ncbi:MAG: alpha/beta hydrolase [Tidjanibacter sp.]|nr:alpha/beta hydrolase [Tidjanibacter sp.]
MSEWVNNRGYYTNVTEPELLVFVPEEGTATGQAMLVVPGGSYKRVCITREGYKTAEMLNKKGIAAFILKYRMPNGHPDVVLEDGEKAMRIIREGAQKWGINPQSVGVIGFSAGGHFAANLLTRYTSAESRPDFGVLVYPVISMKYSSADTRENLLGAQSKDEALRKEFSLQNKVTRKTPPTMIVLTSDDKAVDCQNGIEFYSALQQKKVPCELHIFPSGGHGFWFQKRYKYGEQTYPMIVRWIEEHKAK